MATGKKYYYIKVKQTFLSSDTVDYLMSQKDGANYIVLYQVLALKTTKTLGVFQRELGSVLVPYDAEKISRDCKWFSVGFVKKALKLFVDLDLLEETDGTLHFNDYGNLVGSETDYAEQKRNQRNKDTQVDKIVDKLADKSVDTVKTNRVENVHTEIRDKNIDKEIDTNVSTKKGGQTTRFVPPSVEEVRAYCEERKNGIDAQTFIDFYEARGWKYNSGSMKDWKAAVRTWENKRKTQRTVSAEGREVRDYDIAF